MCARAHTLWKDYVLTCSFLYLAVSLPASLRCNSWPFSLYTQHTLSQQTIHSDSNYCYNSTTPLTLHTHTTPSHYTPTPHPHITHTHSHLTHHTHTPLTPQTVAPPSQLFSVWSDLWLCRRDTQVVSLAETCTQNLTHTRSTVLPLSYKDSQQHSTTLWLLWSDTLRLLWSDTLRLLWSDTPNATLSSLSCWNAQVNTFKTDLWTFSSRLGAEACAEVSDSSSTSTKVGVVTVRGGTGGSWVGVASAEGGGACEGGGDSSAWSF